MSKHRKANTSKQTAGRPVVPEAAHAIDDEARHAMIAEAAYLLAEQRGFQGDAALDDWLRAETEINVRLKASE